jgi:hypothetical protein
MSSSLGPIEIHCDAPPYSIVRAARGLGFGQPEDVRWCRMAHFRADREGHWEFLNPLTWKSALGGGVRNRKQAGCSCGQDLPVLERYIFTFSSGDQVSYLIGQCGRCRTIFWEDA